MLRRAVLQAGIALILVGAILVTLPHHQGGAAPLILGIVLAGGILAERFRYKQDLAIPPGPGWQATPEKTRDETGREVTVWFNPATGERAYIRTK